MFKPKLSTYALIKNAFMPELCVTSQLSRSSACVSINTRKVAALVI